MEFKEKKCRITIKNIKLVSDISCESTALSSVNNLERYALKKLNSEFGVSFLDKPAKIFNYTFDQLMNSDQLIDKNW